MGKAHKKGKVSASQKRDKFWGAIKQQKLKDVRAGLSETGIEAHTRNESGQTSIMLAADVGKDRSLDTLLDWYSRRRELRSKGWIDLRDDDGRTALMIAAGNGHLACVESLLNKGAHPLLKDDNDMTARDLAAKRKKDEVVEAIDYFLLPSDVEEEEGDEETAADGLTSTQRNRLKKRQLQALERRGNAQDDEETTKEVVKEVGPAAIWDEVKQVVTSVEQLHPLQQIAINRTSEDQIGEVERSNGNMDPALWYLYSITRMELLLPKGMLTQLPGDGLLRMDQLQVLIVNNNSLTSLPEEIGQCPNLRVLDAGSNNLTSLPDSLGELSQLDVLDVSNNQLSSIAAIDGCNLAVLNATGNKLTEIDCDLTLLRRLHDMMLADNEIVEIPSTINAVTLLETIVLENNKVEELPLEITELKKVNVLKLAGNPIKDPKVKKMLQKDARKDLWKYLQKVGPKQNAKGKKGKKAKDTSPVSAEQVDVGSMSIRDDDLDLLSDAPEDESFPIKMKDL